MSARRVRVKRSQIDEMGGNTFVRCLTRAGRTALMASMVKIPKGDTISCSELGTAVIQNTAKL
jgi:hypothetical protein